MAYRPYEPFRTDLRPFATPSDGGRAIANINYALYIAGFFTGITPFIGVMLAYMKRGHASYLVRSHLDWQIRVFWHCIAYGIGIFVLHALIVGLGFLTFGVGLVFLIIPWALAAWWLVWTIWAIVKGLQRLGRDEPIR